MKPRKVQNPDLAYQKMLARLRSAEDKGEQLDWIDTSTGATIELIEACEEFFTWGVGEHLISLQYPGIARKRRAFYRLDFEIPFYGATMFIDFEDTIDWGYFYHAIGGLASLNFFVRPLDSNRMRISEAKRMAEVIHDGLDNHDPLWECTISIFTFRGKYLHVALMDQDSTDQQDPVGECIFRDCSSKNKKR